MGGGGRVAAVQHAGPMDVDGRHVTSCSLEAGQLECFSVASWHANKVCIPQPGGHGAALFDTDVDQSSLQKHLGLMYKTVEDDPAFSFEATIALIDSLQQNINDLHIFTRRFDYYPFDAVAGEIIAKAFVLCRAVIVLVKSGFPDEAFALCRSLF
jgi:hypothetical protein